MSGVGRVLVCSPVMPAYDRESGSRRIFNLIEFLQEAGWSVSFMAGSGHDGQRYVKALQQRGVATFTSFDQARQVIEAGRFDLAVLAFWYVGETLTSVIRALSPETRVIVDSIDLHYMRGARGAFLEPGGRLDANYALQMAREINAYAASDGVLAVSKKEADLINDLVGDPELSYTVPLGEDLPASDSPFDERKGMLFLGNFRHAPNGEAVRYLCKEVLPYIDSNILSEHPVYVVGNAMTDTVRGYGDGLDHVQMVGWVPSLLPYLQRTRVSLVPLLYGAGTKGKLIQALTVGTPSVSTSIGVEGLDLRDGEHILVADDPAAFADSTVRLLTDADLWERLASQGQAHIMSNYSRESARESFMRTVSAVLAKGVKPVGDNLDNSDLRQLGAGQLKSSNDHDIRRLMQNNQKLAENNQRLVENNGKLKTFAENNQRLVENNGKLKTYASKLEKELHAVRGSRSWRVLGLYRRLRTGAIFDKMR